MFTKTDSKSNVKPKDGRHCDLCGCTTPAVRCDKCNSQIFCLSCDDMYHRHPKRRFHLRKAVDPTPTPSARPVLPMKVANLPVAPGDPSKMPLPPPRKKKPTKSIFDSFRRGSPVTDINPNLPKKEFTWGDRFGSIKKFMSQRPLPPVPPDDGAENFPPEADVQSRGDFSFIHTKANDKPPALPQRNQQKSPDDSFQKPLNGTTQNENVTHQNGVWHRSHLNNVHPEMTEQWNAHQIDRKYSLQLPQKTSENSQNFGTIRRSSQPPLRSKSPSPANAEDKMQGGMQQSSSVTDLHALSMMGMPSYPQYPFAPPIPPQYPGGYPMYPHPQYPGYLQYFGSSWANLASPPQTTDGDFSDQSENSGIQVTNWKHMSYKDKKAKRSHSVVVDRVPYQGQFYPYGPYPPGGYPPPPWIPGHRPKDAPPSPATSMRSLSRLSQSHQKNKPVDDGEDDFSSSSLSRPKSSSSDMSKTRQIRRQASSSSSSEAESGKDRRRPKASPAMERRLLKQEMLRRRNSSPRQASSSQESPMTGRRHSAEHRKVGKFQSLKSSQREKAEIPDNDTNKLKLRKKVQRKEEKDLTSSENEDPSPIEKKTIQQPTSGRWYCKHCTFLNEPGERICRVCCKTGVKTDESSCESPQNQKQSTADSEQPKIEKNRNLEKTKQEITSLNSALDEAEKEISRSLGELLKIKEESNSEDFQENGNENSAKNIETSMTNQTQNMSKSNESTNSQIHKISPATSPVKDNAHALNIQNKDTNEITKSTSNATIMANENESLKKHSENVGKDIISAKGETKADAHVSKDSFCQTYEDVVVPEFSTNKQQSDQTTPQVAQQDRGMNLQSPLPYELNNLERGFNGFFGMQRAHSRASLFGGRMNDASPITSEFANMGLIPPTMYRSLSRTSLLGDNEGWPSEYYARNKPDFYLSMEELVERRRQETMRAQGLELVRMIREAEQQGFTADDIQVALNNCGKQNPVTWLQDNWKNMVHTVVSLATNYGRDKKENDVGGISQIEARDALRLHKGNIWAAVTECVESRQRKFLELSARGNFSMAAIAEALTSSKGDVETAYSELTKTSLKPFLMRIWGSGEGAQNLDAAYPENFSGEIKCNDIGINEEKLPVKGNESESDQEIWEDGEYDDEIEGEWEEYEENKDDNEESEGNEVDEEIATKKLMALERMNSNPSEVEKSNTLTSTLTHESDVSEYCDAFSSALSERYLSSTSIDEIYLLGIEDGEDMQSDIDEKQEPKAKGTGFLKQLADLKKTGSSKLDDLMKFDNGKNEKENKKVEEISISSTEPQNLKEKKKVKESTDTFNPLGVLKRTFSALKDTVTQNTGNKSPSMYERRTIIVQDKIPKNLSERNIKSISNVSSSTKSNIPTSKMPTEQMGAKKSNQSEGMNLEVSNSSENKINDTSSTHDVLNDTQDIAANIKADETSILDASQINKSIPIENIKKNKMPKTNKTIEISALNKKSENKISANNTKNSEIKHSEVCDKDAKMSQEQISAASSTISLQNQSPELNRFDSETSLEDKSNKTVEEHIAKDAFSDNDAMLEDDPTIEINNCIRRINELINMHDFAADSDTENEELIINQEKSQQPEADQEQNKDIPSTTSSPTTFTNQNNQDDDVEIIEIAEKTSNDNKDVSAENENCTICPNLEENNLKGNVENENTMITKNDVAHTDDVHEKLKMSNKSRNECSYSTNKDLNQNLSENKELSHLKTTMALKENKITLKEVSPELLINKLESYAETENNIKEGASLNTDITQLQENSKNIESVDMIPTLSDIRVSNCENKNENMKEDPVIHSNKNNIIEQKSSDFISNSESKIEGLNTVENEGIMELSEGLQNVDNIAENKSSTDNKAFDTFKQNSGDCNKKMENKLSIPIEQSLESNKSSESTIESENTVDEAKLNEPNDSLISINSKNSEKLGDIQNEQSKTEILKFEQLKDETTDRNTIFTNPLVSKPDTNSISISKKETGETSINSKFEVSGENSKQKLISGDNKEVPEPTTTSSKDNNAVKLLKKKKKKKDNSLNINNSEASTSKVLPLDVDKIATTPEIKVDVSSKNINNNVDDISLKIVDLSSLQQKQNEINESRNSKCDINIGSETQQEILNLESEILLDEGKTKISENISAVDDKSDNFRLDDEIVIVNNKNVTENSKSLTENKTESTITEKEVKKMEASEEKVLSNSTNIRVDDIQIAGSSKDNETILKNRENNSETQNGDEENKIESDDNDKINTKSDFTLDSNIPNITNKNENEIAPSNEEINKNENVQKVKVSESGVIKTVNNVEINTSKAEWKKNETTKDENNASGKSVEIEDKSQLSKNKTTQESTDATSNEEQINVDHKQAVQESSNIIRDNKATLHNEDENTSGGANMTSSDKNLSDNEQKEQNHNKIILNTEIATKNEENEITDANENQIPSNLENISEPSSNDPIEDELSNENSYIEENIAPVNPIRPVGHLRRMSFNTRKQAIIQERVREFEKIGENKPIFLQKKDTFKPAFPKRTIKQQLEFERRVRQLVSDRKCRTYRKAEIIVQLLDMNFEESEAIEAAHECSRFDQAVSYLQQECLLCARNYPIREIISMVHCSHKACRECIKAYFTIQIRDRTIVELLCPFCNEPDITDEDVAQDYFNHLDIMLKKLVDENIHELFQRKLRDRVLMKDPNFRWCTQCSSGFIADPYLKKLMCPDCKAIMCASCRRLWERAHEGASCEAFAAYKDSTDPDAQNTGLAKLLTENGIDCPSCHFKYALAKGGCMHFKCIQCQHDFCSGCTRPFKIGQKCGVSEFCAKLGLHAHHPRNCLFYLRDKEPTDLQKLLDMNDIRYDTDPPEMKEQMKTCQVLEQKETPQGMIDDICGKEVENGFAGLCRLHYVEYLGQLVNEHKVDPIQIFDNDDLELVLRRASIRLPPKKYRESQVEYRDKLLQVIEEKLPLGEVEGS